MNLRKELASENGIQSYLSVEVVARIMSHSYYFRLIRFIERQQGGAHRLNDARPG